MLKINGILLPSPDTIEVSIYDIDGETFRNANGDLIRDRITTKRKLKCKWSYLTSNKISIILQNIKEEFFTIEYIDPEEGQQIAKTFYVGDRVAPILIKQNDLNYFWSLSLNFIER